jgi:hypothetical protein
MEKEYLENLVGGEGAVYRIMHHAVMDYPAAREAEDWMEGQG